MVKEPIVKAWFVNGLALVGWAFLFMVAVKYKLVWLTILCFLFMPYHAYVIGTYMKDTE